MALACVPFQAQFTGDTKLDLRAIYKRPNGDLTSGMPMRRHSQWAQNGLEYVTLADADSLQIAAPFLRASGLNPQDYVCGVDGDGRPTPWNVAKYLEGAAADKVSADQELKALVDKYGADVVESIKGVKVPANMKTAARKAAEKVA